MNKVFFQLLVIVQLLQSMSFNGVLDIPTLMLITFLNAFFGFRKSYATFYARFTFFFVGYLTILIYIKVIFNTVSEIQYVKQWFIRQTENLNSGTETKQTSHVKILSIIFGVDS